MIRRHWLTLVFIVVSIAGGLLAVSPAVGGKYLYPWGIAGLLAVTLVLFFVSLLSWQRMSKKQHARDPRQSVLYQGAAFTAWFSGLNLSWTLLSAVCALGLILAFGPRTWVLALIAGTLACALFSLLGLLRIKRRQMMGLCWQSPVPFNLTDRLDRTAATMILTERFEYAADYDQKQSTPVLWSISRIFDRGETGGSHRKLDLMDRNLPKKKMKMEWWQRMKIMAFLFLATSILAALPGLLGLTSTQWDRVPDGWPSAKAREIAEKEKQQMAVKQPPKQQSQQRPQKPGQKQDPDKTKDNNRNNRMDKEKERTDTQQQQQDSQGSNGKSDTTAPGDQKPAQEGQDGQKGDSGQKQGDARKDTRTGEKAKEGESGKETESSKDGEPGNEEKNRKQGEKQEGEEKQGKKEDGGDSENQGDCDKPGGQGKPGQNSKPGEGDKDGQGQKQDTEGKDGGKPGQEGEGKKDGKGKKGGSGENGQQKESGGGEGAESDKKGGDSQAGGAQDGKKGTKGGGPGGEGQGKGSPDDVPKMDNDPHSQPLQKFPSRETGMVNLELPTLAPTGAKGESKKEEKKDEKKIKGDAAPGSVFKTGTQDRRIKKPQQFLPNWILMLIKTTGSDKNTNTRKR